MNAELELLKEAVTAAGDAILKIGQQPILTINKENNSPLTNADITSNQILREYLLSRYPNDGWFSEETQDDFKRLNKNRVWIVDPLDGTKEFINHIPDYVVSAALVENSIPILSSIYNPNTKELYYAVKGSGAWKNNQKIMCNYAYVNKIEVLASRTEIDKGAWKCFQNRLIVNPKGSIAYKLAQVAEGKTHCTFSLEPRSEWDIAAGVLLVEEAGGIVHDLKENKFKFNQKNSRVNGIIASAHHTHARLLQMIQPELARATT